MSYDPALDSEVATILSGDQAEPRMLRDSGVALLCSSNDSCIEKIASVIDFVAEIDILCNKDGVADALITRTKVSKKLRAMFRAHPIGLIVDYDSIENIEPFIIVTHGMFSRIVIVTMSDDVGKLNGKIYNAIATINSHSSNMIKHFGYKTHFVIKGICSKLSKEYRQIQKKMSLYREDARLSEVVMEQSCPIEENEETQKIEDRNENIES